MLTSDPQIWRAILIRGIFALLVILILSLPFLQNLSR